MLGGEVVVDVAEPDARPQREREQEPGYAEREPAARRPHAGAQRGADHEHQQHDQHQSAHHPLHGVGHGVGGRTGERGPREPLEREHGQHGAAGDQRQSSRSRARPSGEDQPRDAPPGEDLERQHQVSDQPRHLLAGPGVGAPGGDRPPQQEREEAAPIGAAHDRLGRGALGRFRLGDDLFGPRSPLRRIPRRAPQRDRRRHDRDRAGDQRQDLVQHREQQVVEPGLAAARDLVLRQPVAEAADDAGRETAAEVGEEGGEEQDREAPEQRHRPGEVAQAQPRLARASPQRRGTARACGSSPRRWRRRSRPACPPPPGRARGGRARSSPARGRRRPTRTATPTRASAP